MKKLDALLSGSKIGMLTNQSAYGWEHDYHFRTIKAKYGLKKLFLPEHGLFAELQDQVSGSSLSYNLGDTRILNLYGDAEESLVPSPESLDGLDTILIDIRDVGARYYTFLTSALYLLQTVDRKNREGVHRIKVVVFDSPNPAGNKVEGSPLEEKYSSFVGIPGVLHRHGLTAAGLLEFYKDKFGLDFEFYSFGKMYSKNTDPFLWVPPSPNIPSFTTCFVYAGLCLLEGTNLSEGRGTTRPFETFGAPYLNDSDERLRKTLEEPQKGVFHLRPLRLIPTFHKHAGKVCGGFQILLEKPSEFHSLLFGLHLLRTLKEFYPVDFSYLKGPYEYRSDLSAIELLVGDDFLLGYLDGKSSYLEVEEYLSEKERLWRKETKAYRK
ncbi:DUF1343 domain-containing protein [Leptospira fletcheri]|uniref:DUF1343 domain-containing protein n=1 Tax=Leptospira fletcheri TaxID=2484981 RepID=A0A4R9GFG7_9LEPT|nr:DUF1343 domain-containing protein [Leptospira fletcheri]TGK10040.1 DUF1343 domain-containing protein [Leptospira fletcheri]